MALSRERLAEIGALLHEVRDAYSLDRLVVSIGTRGPNIDCRDGNMIATVTVGNDTETAEAVHLQDAICLATAKCKAEAEKRKKKAEE